MAIEYIQKSFIGGMNQNYDATRIGEDQYWLLINGRSRKDTVHPIKQPLMQTDGLPTNTFYQSIYSSGKFALVFVNGKAYYRDYTISNSIFGQIIGFQMSADVDRIYAELVPASTVDFKRSLSTTDKSGEITFTSSISGTSQCVVVQDGINQPRIIFPDGSWRIAQTYSQWANDDDGTNPLAIREYIPIGKQMLFVGGVLYVVNGPHILRSVTGRPLDFMINIDINGNKLPIESDGDAYSTSHAVDFDDITCISRVTGGGLGAFLVSTDRFTYLTVPNYNRLIFGEPTLESINASDNGVNNQFSVLDVVGDMTYISKRGIGSFNATKLLLTESNNNPFSAAIYPIFENKATDETIIQDITCAIRFNDYGLYAINTKYGYGVIVYDIILQKFVSFDIYESITSPIKQFTNVRIGEVNILLFITNNNLYQAFSSDQLEKCSLYLREWCSNDPSIEQKSMQLNLVLVDSLEDGEIVVTLYSDKVKDITVSDSIIKSQNPESINVTIPFNEPDSDAVQNIAFNFGRGRQGWKLGFLIEWDCGCELSHIKLETSDITPINSFERKAKSYASFTATT